MKIKDIKFFKKFNTLRAKHEYLSVIWLVLALLIFVGLNIGAKILTEKFSLKVDLTKNKAFSLTDDSKNYISSLQKDVEIIVLNEEDKFISNGDYFEQSNSVIKEYENCSEKVQVKYVNLENNPNIKNEYSEEDIKENGIIVKSGENHKILSAYDLFNIQQSYNGGTITSSKAEQAMTSAIISVISDSKVKINVVTGFDEFGSSDLIKMLDSNNYEVKTVSMLNEDLEEDSAAVVICGPSRDYDEETMGKIKNYLSGDVDSNKNLIYFISPDQKIPNKISEFIKEWGIGINSGIIFETDPSKKLMNQGFYTLCEYEESNEEYANLVKNKSIPVALPMSRPLEALDANKAKTLLKFSKTCGIYPLDAGPNWQPGENDINKGPLPCVLISENKNEQTGKKSTVTVVGSVMGVSEALLSRNSLNNSSYFINLFNKITDKEETVNIEPKTIGAQDMIIDSNMATYIGLGFAVGLPIAVLFIGFLVWLTRRKK